MKNLNIHKIILALLLFVSLSSYIYINTVNVECNNKCAKYTLPQVEENEEDEKSPAVIAPDVELVKKMLGKSQILTVISKIF